MRHVQSACCGWPFKIHNPIDYNIMQQGKYYYLEVDYLVQGPTEDRERLVNSWPTT